MQGTNRITGVNYNISNNDAVLGSNCPAVCTYTYSSHPLYLQVQALERENSGLRAKLEALTGTMGGQFAMSRIHKPAALSSKVTRMVEEEIERIMKQYNDVLVRKHIYKKRFLKVMSTLKGARNSLRIVLDVARLHQHPTLLQAVHNIEDSLMLSWPEEDISDYEPTNLGAGAASPPPPPLTMLIHETNDASKHTSVVSSHDSPRDQDNGQAPSYYGAVRIEQRDHPPVRLPPMQKREQYVCAQSVIQKEKEVSDIKRDNHSNTSLNLPSNPSKQEDKKASFRGSDFSESSYLANSSLLLALEKRVASEVADVVQSAYERHIRNTEPLDSSTSISILETPKHTMSSTSSEDVQHKHRQRDLMTHSETLSRNPTPSPIDGRTSGTSATSIGFRSELSTPSVGTATAPIITQSALVSASPTESVPVLVSVTASSNQLDESVEALVTPAHSKDSVPLSSNTSLVKSVECSTSLPLVSSSKNVSNTSQSVSVNSFICGMNEIIDDGSVASDIGNPLMVFSPRAEEYISQVSSISANNNVSASALVGPVNGSHVQHALKMQSSRVTLPAIAGSVESDMLVSDINVMKQTARQQQLAATRLLESKGADNSSSVDPQTQNLESTESMGLIIDRSRAATGVSKVGLSAYLSEALLVNSGDMGITPDIADFCLSRPITADQEEAQHASASYAAKNPSNAAVLTTAMLDKSPPVLENPTKSQEGSAPLMQSSSLNN